MISNLDVLFVLTFITLYYGLVLANFPPDKPNHVTLFADTDNIRVRWNSPTNTYGKIRKYLVSWAILPNVTDTASAIYVDGSVKIASIAVGSDAGRLFRVRVRAQNHACIGQYSEPRYIRIGCSKDVIIKPQDNVSITSPGFGVHKLKPGVICLWNVTTKETFKLRISLDTLDISRTHISGNQCLDSYVNISSFGTVCNINEGINITINGMHTNILLRTSINEAGRGISMTVTSVPGIPGPPVNISVHVFQHKLVITWQPPIEKTLPITSYNIQYSVISLLTVFKVALGSSMRMFSVNSDNFEGQLVTFTIAAVIGQTQGQMSRPYYVRAFSPKQMELSVPEGTTYMPPASYAPVMPSKSTDESTPKTTTHIQLSTYAQIVSSTFTDMATIDTYTHIPSMKYKQTKQSIWTTRTTKHRRPTTHAQVKQSKHKFFGDDGAPSTTAGNASTTPANLASTESRHIWPEPSPILYSKNRATIHPYLDGKLVKHRTFQWTEYSTSSHLGLEYSPATVSNKPEMIHHVLIESSSLARNKTIPWNGHTNKGFQLTKSPKKPELLHFLNETFLHTRHKTYPWTGYTNISSLSKYKTATSFENKNTVRLVLTTVEYKSQVKNYSSSKDITTKGIWEEEANTLTGNSRKLHETSTVFIVVLSGCGVFVFCVMAVVLQNLYRRRRRAKIHSEITGRYSRPDIELHDILRSVSSKKPLTSIYGTPTDADGKFKRNRRFSFPLGRSRKMCKDVEKRLAAFSFIEDKTILKTNIHRILQRRRTNSC